MKYLLSIAVALFALASCSSPEPEVVAIPVSEEVVEVVANSESKLFISGMTCVMGCKGAIEKDLNKTAGIESFNIVFEDSIATVRFDSTLISEEAIVAAVGAVAGGGLYTATPVNE